MYSKYQPQVKKYATLNPEVEQEILNTVLNGLEPIENLQPSTFKVKIYDPNTDSVKLLTKDSVDNTGKSLEDLQKNIIVPLLEDLQKLDNTVIKKVVPSINRTPPYEFNDNMNELQLDTNLLGYFLDDETKLLGKFVDTPNVIKSFGQPMLTQKILATRNELEEILGKDAMPGQYVGRTIEKTPEVSKNLALDTFANKYKDWMQNTASTDVLVIGKDGN